MEKSKFYKWFVRSQLRKIYSINTLKLLLQDYLILRKFEHIDDNLIQIVEKKEDLTNQTRKIFLVPASNKNFVSLIT